MNSQETKASGAQETKASGAQEIAVVGTEETCTGFRLGGVQKVYNAGTMDAGKKIEELLGMDGIGIIIVNEKILEKIDFRLKKLIGRTAKPVVIAVPDKDGASSEAENLKALVKRAIGFELV